MRSLAAVLAALLAGCASLPLQPDATLDLTGRWTIMAVNGEPTGRGRAFNLELKPSYGAAQFGCNTGSGSYTVRDGWLVTGNWIITAAGCLDKDEWLRFERKGFEILGKPLAIERRSGGIRLRNALGTIDLVPTPPVTAADVVGTWNVVSINGVGTTGGERFRVTFTRDRIDGRFGCNWFRGVFTIENGRFRPIGGENTEMACEAAGPTAPAEPLMTLEEWAFAVLRSGPEVKLRSERGMQLTSPEGTIDLVRAR